MKHDEAYRRILRAEMNAAFSALDDRPSMHDAIMRRIRAQKRVTRKTSVTLVFAIVLTLALGGMAVAAGLGLFGQLRENKVDETSYARLALLEDAALAVGQTQRIAVPAFAAEKPQTTRAALLAAQQGREYTLTIDQVYCDGRKLYYAYTFRMKDEPLTLHEGAATGFDVWNEAYPGEWFEDVFDTGLGEAYDAAAAAWLDDRDEGYVVVKNAYVGDGAKLTDGTELIPVDSGDACVDAQTRSAYYEVALPTAYQAGETIEFVLSVITHDMVYAQDESGAYSASLFDPHAVIEVPVSVRVTGEADVRTGAGEADGYAAEAVLYASDVDISGFMRIEAPEDYMPESYMLLADGVEYRNLDEWSRYDGQAHVLNLRYDLPAQTDNLVLIPIDPAYAHEAITLK